MDREGSLHLVWLNKGNSSEPKYSVAFADNQSGGAMKNRAFVGEDALRGFLTEQVGADSNSVDTALRELKEDGTASLHRIILSDEQHDALFPKVVSAGE